MNGQHSIQLILKALAFAAHKHRDQRRKDSDASPYINHPIDLANILCNEAKLCTPSLLCAALLHDTLEDTDTTPEELTDQFGPEVCRIVMDVTDDKSLPKAERKRAQIEHAAETCAPAKLVKLADKIANLRDLIHRPPADWSTERKQAYFDWAKAVIDQVRGANPVLEALFDAEFCRRPD